MKYKIILITLIAIISLSGCSFNSQTDTPHTNSGDDTVSVTSNNFQTIKNIYETLEFKQWLLWMYPDSPYQSYRPDISYIDSLFPIEYSQKTDDTHEYTVYKTKRGFVYMFFEKSSATDIMEYRFSSYMEKALSYSDFKNVKVGTPIGEVEKIDPAVTVKKAAYIDMLSDAELSFEDEGFIDIRILTDGVLFIKFNREANSSKYKVEYIAYFDNFIIDSSVLPEDALTKHYGDYTINCKILEQDYPE